MIGVGVSLPELAVRGGGWSPASLFAGGVSGTMPDLSDLSTLFQDEAGATPVASDADVVGLMIDQSQGGLGNLGPELVTNGGFDTDLSGWDIVGDGSAVSVSGSLSITGGAVSNTGVRQDISLQNGTYLVPIGGVGGSSPRFGIYDGVSTIISNQIGSVSDVIVTITQGVMRVYPYTSAGLTALYDSISVRGIPGNHASQSTTSYKPKWYAPNILRFDGVDDRLPMTLKPTTAGSIAVRFKANVGNCVVFGARPSGTTGKCYVSLASDGSIAGGVGDDGAGQIKGSTDKLGVFVTAILTWDGTTVTLYEDGVSVYSAAQSGAVDTANPHFFGSLNFDGSSAAHFDGDVSNLIVTDDVITASEALKLHNKWSA
ncbi:LamG domain-containing protein [Shimia aestuarii]|uniref:LamG domain-containing protein n=1 Tax=Shimia aestuarii TaxID=254406 RepID=UPI001FB2356A|nr:LamG domain-containing protein [Shimia aestuarii]